MQQFSVSSYQKKVSEAKGYVMTTIQCPSVFCNVSVSSQSCNFIFALIFIKILLKKLKFMHEFTFTMNVECLHSNLLAK